MLVVRTTEDPADPLGELAGAEHRAPATLCLEWIHLGSIALSHGLLVGKKHATIRTPGRWL